MGGRATVCSLCGASLCQGWTWEARCPWEGRVGVDSVSLSTRNRPIEKISGAALLPLLEAVREIVLVA